MYTNMFGLPETWHFENYAGLFADMGFGKSIFNSFFITITTVVCQLGHQLYGILCHYTDSL